MPFDLIHTHNENAAALTIDQMKERCPAAFSTGASPETSGRYGFVNTADAITILQDNGFQPVRAIQKPSRKGGSVLFNDHMISFNAPKAFDGEGEQGNLILYNSHNAKSSLRIFCGAYRYICSNGIVAGEGFEAKMRHSMLTANSFNDLVNDQAQALPALMDNIDRLKSIAMDPKQVLDFAYDAAELRWGMDPTWKPNSELTNTTEAESLRGSFATAQTVTDMNATRRYGDAGSDAWTVFNRAQESLIRGGVRIRSYTERNQHGANRKARPIAALAETVRVNRKLWDMADALA
jgi:hypothetical protein